MNNPDKKSEMKDVEIMIGKVLQVGVYISAIIITIGILLWFFNGTGYSTSGLPKDFGTIWFGTLNLKAYAVVMFGIFLLILTPVLRVVVSIYAFAKENDQMYVWITSLVLIILIVGMVIGYTGK